MSKGGGCMTPVGVVVAAGLMVYFVIEPESAQRLLLQVGQTFVELVRAFGDLLERESSGGGASILPPRGPGS